MLDFDLMTKCTRELGCLQAVILASCPHCGKRALVLDFDERKRDFECLHCRRQGPIEKLVDSVEQERRDRELREVEELMKGPGVWKRRRGKLTQVRQGGRL